MAYILEMTQCEMSGCMKLIPGDEAFFNEYDQAFCCPEHMAEAEMEMLDNRYDWEDYFLGNTRNAQ